MAIKKHSWIILIVLLIGMFLLILGWGSVSIPLPEVLKILGGKTPTEESWKTIVLEVRLPRAFTAMLAGIALSVSGLQMQTFFRNPLAGPFVLGINAGADLGVALVVLSGVWLGVDWTLYSLWQQLGVVVAAVLGASTVLVGVLAIARKVDNPMTLLILGLMVGYATSGIVNVLMYFSQAAEIQSYVNWSFGSFSGVSWQQLPIFALILLIGWGMAAFSVKPLNALLLGETYAKTLGVSMKQVRLTVIISTAILAGATTAFCGPIGFLGMAVPHLCRNAFQTADHRILIPAVSLLGAILALLAEFISKLPGSDLTLPVNAVTALIGAPVVIWVVLRHQTLK